VAACARLLRRQFDLFAPAVGHGDPVTPVLVDGAIGIADQRLDARSEQARASDADADSQREPVVAD